MVVLQGVYWISNRSYNGYLCADPGGNVGITPLGPRGLDLLNSTAPRNQIWLIEFEKATDGKNIRFRNYETGAGLDIEGQSYKNGATIVVTSGSSESQVWEVNWLETNPLGAVYQIKNALTSKALQISDNYGYVSGRQARKVMSHQPQTQPYARQSWLIEPIPLPTLYSIVNLAAPALVLSVSDRPYASDNTSRGVRLARKELSAWNQLWTFEYNLAGETVLRNALYNQFVLDPSAQDSQTLVARNHHGGPNQLWRVKDEDENNQIVSLANAKTGTLLATRKRQPLGGPPLDTLAAVVEGNTRWQIYPSPQPPFFWVTIQNSQTGAFLIQAEDGSVEPSKGPLHANDHSSHWRFIMLGKDPRYVIVNRTTGFVLEHSASLASVVAENDDRSDASRHWTLGSFGDIDIIIVSVGSQCALNHQSGNPVQARRPEINNPSYQWVIMPFYDTLPSFALVNAFTGKYVANTPTQM